MRVVFATLELFVKLFSETLHFLQHNNKSRNPWLEIKHFGNTLNQIATKKACKHQDFSQCPQAQ